MSLAEKKIMHIIQQYSDEQLLDIKYHGTDSLGYRTIEEDTDAKYYQDFALSRIADELMTRGLMDSGSEFRDWWNKWRSQ